MKCAEPTTFHRKSGMWGTRSSVQGQKCPGEGRVKYLSRRDPVKLVRRTSDTTAGVLFDYFGLRL
jgi:hypothetical protein